MSSIVALPAIVAAVLVLFLSAHGHGSIVELLRVILTLPLVLFIPGWTLLRALGGPICAWPLRATMIVAASLTETVIVGLALNALSFAALDLEGWAVGMGLLATLQLAAAAFRIPPSGTIARPRPSGWHALLLVPVLVATAAVWLSVRSAATEPSPAFTQLWLHAKDGSVVVGVANFDGTGKSFRLVLTDAALGFRRQYTVVLDSGRSWSRVVQVGPGPAASKVTATLYRDGGPNAYRWVSLRVPASAASPVLP